MITDRYSNQMLMMSQSILVICIMNDYTGRQCKGMLIIIRIHGKDENITQVGWTYYDQATLVVSRRLLLLNLWWHGRSAPQCTQGVSRVTVGCVTPLRSAGFFFTVFICLKI